MKLPAMPDPKYIYHGSPVDGGDDLFVVAESGAVDEGCADCERLYTEAQMLAYAEAVRERCAQLADTEAMVSSEDEAVYAYQNIAARIRE